MLCPSSTLSTRRAGLRTAWANKGESASDTVRHPQMPGAWREESEESPPARLMGPQAERPRRMNALLVPPLQLARHLRTDIGPQPLGWHP